MRYTGADTKNGVSDGGVAEHQFVAPDTLVGLPDLAIAGDSTTDVLHTTITVSAERCWPQGVCSSHPDQSHDPNYRKVCVVLPNISCRIANEPTHSLAIHREHLRNPVETHYDETTRRRRVWEQFDRIRNATDHRILNDEPIVPKLRKPARFSQQSVLSTAVALGELLRENDVLTEI